MENNQDFDKRLNELTALNNPGWSPDPAKSITAANPVLIPQDIENNETFIKNFHLNIDSFTNYNILPAFNLTVAKIKEFQESADYGMVQFQSMLFKSILDHDPIISAHFNTRYLSVLSKEWTIQGGENEYKRESVTDMLEMAGIEKIIQHLMQAILFGYSGARVHWEDLHDDKIFFEYIDPTNWRFTREGGISVLDKYGMIYPITSENARCYIIHTYGYRTGIPCTTGLLRILSWTYFFKQIACRHKARFLEKLGIPQFIAKISKEDFTNDTLRATIQRQFQQMGADGVGLTTENAEITALQVGGSQSTNGEFLPWIDYHDKCSALLLLGQIASSSEASGFSKGQIQENVRNDITEADCHSISQTITRCLIRPLELMKWGTKELSFQINAKPQADIKAVTEQINAIRNIGYEPDEDWISKSLGIPIKKIEALIKKIPNTTATPTEQQIEQSTPTEATANIPGNNQAMKQPNTAATPTTQEQANQNIESMSPASVLGNAGENPAQLSDARLLRRPILAFSDSNPQLEEAIRGIITESDLTPEIKSELNTANINELPAIIAAQKSEALSLQTQDPEYNDLFITLDNLLADVLKTEADYTAPQQVIAPDRTPMAQQPEFKQTQTPDISQAENIPNQVDETGTQITTAQDTESQAAAQAAYRTYQDNVKSIERLKQKNPEQYQTELLKLREKLMSLAQNNPKIQNQEFARLYLDSGSLSDTLTKDINTIVAGPKENIDTRIKVMFDEAWQNIPERVQQTLTRDKVFENFSTIAIRRRKIADLYAISQKQEYTIGGEKPGIVGSWFDSLWQGTETMAVGFSGCYRAITELFGNEPSEEMKVFSRNYEEYVAKRPNYFKDHQFDNFATKLLAQSTVAFAEMLPQVILGAAAGAIPGVGPLGAAAFWGGLGFGEMYNGARNKGHSAESAALLGIPAAALYSVLGMVEMGSIFKKSAGKEALEAAINYAKRESKTLPYGQMAIEAMLMRKYTMPYSDQMLKSLDKFASNKFGPDIIDTVSQAFRNPFINGAGHVLTGAAANAGQTFIEEMNDGILSYYNDMRQNTDTILQSKVGMDLLDDTLNTFKESLLPLGVMVGTHRLVTSAISRPAPEIIDTKIKVLNRNLNKSEPLDKNTVTSILDGTFEKNAVDMTPEQAEASIEDNPTIQKTLVYVINKNGALKQAIKHGELDISLVRPGDKIKIGDGQSQIVSDNIEGLYGYDTRAGKSHIFINADTVNDINLLSRVMQHEGFGHFYFLGDKSPVPHESKAKVIDLINRLSKDENNGFWTKNDEQTYRDHYAKINKTQQEINNAIQVEKITHFFDNYDFARYKDNSTLRIMWNDIVRWFKNTFPQIFGKMTDSDIYDFIQDTYSKYKNKLAQSEVRLSYEPVNIFRNVEPQYAGLKKTQAPAPGILSYNQWLDQNHPIISAIQNRFPNGITPTTGDKTAKAIKETWNSAFITPNGAHADNALESLKSKDILGEAALPDNTTENDLLDKLQNIKQKDLRRQYLDYVREEKLKNHQLTPEEEANFKSAMNFFDNIGKEEDLNLEPNKQTNIETADELIERFKATAKKLKKEKINVSDNEQILKLLSGPQDPLRKVRSTLTEAKSLSDSVNELIDKVIPESNQKARDTLKEDFANKLINTTLRPKNVQSMFTQLLNTLTKNKNIIKSNEIAEAKAKLNQLKSNLEAFMAEAGKRQEFAKESMNIIRNFLTSNGGKLKFEDEQIIKKALNEQIFKRNGLELKQADWIRSALQTWTDQLKINDEQRYAGYLKVVHAIDEANIPQSPSQYYFFHELIDKNDNLKKYINGDSKTRFNILNEANKQFDTLSPEAKQKIIDAYWASSGGLDIALKIQNELYGWLTLQKEGTPIQGQIMTGMGLPISNELRNAVVIFNKTLAQSKQFDSNVKKQFDNILSKVDRIIINNATKLDAEIPKLFDITSKLATIWKEAATATEAQIQKQVNDVLTILRSSKLQNSSIVKAVEEAFKSLKNSDPGKVQTAIYSLRQEILKLIENANKKKALSTLNETLETALSKLGNKPNEKNKVDAKAHSNLKIIIGNIYAGRNYIKFENLMSEISNPQNPLSLKEKDALYKHAGYFLIHTLRHMDDIIQEYDSLDARVHVYRAIKRLINNAEKGDDYTGNIARDIKDIQKYIIDASLEHIEIDQKNNINTILNRFSEDTSKYNELNGVINELESLIDKQAIDHIKAREILSDTNRQKEITNAYQGLYQETANLEKRGLSVDPNDIPYLDNIPLVDSNTSSVVKSLLTRAVTRLRVLKDTEIIELDNNQYVNIVTARDNILSAIKEGDYKGANELINNLKSEYSHIDVYPTPSERDMLDTYSSHWDKYQQDTNTAQKDFGDALQVLNNIMGTVPEKMFSKDIYQLNDDINEIIKNGENLRQRLDMGHRNKLNSDIAAISNEVKESLVKAGSDSDNIFIKSLSGVKNSSDVLLYGTSTPNVIFDILTRFRDRWGRDSEGNFRRFVSKFKECFWDSFIEAYNQHRLIIDELKNDIAMYMSPVLNDRARLGSTSINLDVHEIDSRGIPTNKTIKESFTINELMFIYASSLNPDNRKHITAVYTNSQNRKKYQLSKENLSQVTEYLTNKEPQVKASIDSLIDYFSTTLYEKLNKVYKRVNHANMPHIDKYFPINLLLKDYTITPIEEELKIRRFTKSTGEISAIKDREGSSLPFRDFDFFKTVDKHIADVTHYMAFKPLIQDLRYYVSTPNKDGIGGIGNLLENNPHARDAIIDWINRVASGGSNMTMPKTKMEIFMSRARRFTMTQLLAWNIASALRNFTSYLPGTATCGISERVTALGMIGSMPVDTYRMIKEVSEIMKSRSIETAAMVNVEAGEIKDWIKTKFKVSDINSWKYFLTKKEGLKELYGKTAFWSMFPTMAIDNFTANAAWITNYIGILRKLGHKEFFEIDENGMKHLVFDKAAKDYADGEILKTQTLGDVRFASKWFASGNVITQLCTPFLRTMNQQQNRFTEWIGQMLYNPDKTVDKKLDNLMAIAIAGPMAGLFMTCLDGQILPGYSSLPEDANKNPWEVFKKQASHNWEVWLKNTIDQGFAGFLGPNILWGAATNFGIPLIKAQRGDFVSNRHNANFMDSLAESWTPMLLRYVSTSFAQPLDWQIATYSAKIIPGAPSLVRYIWNYNTIYPITGNYSSIFYGGAGGTAHTNNPASWIVQGAGKLEGLDQWIRVQNHKFPEIAWYPTKTPNTIIWKDTQTGLNLHIKLSDSEYSDLINKQYGLLSNSSLRYAYAFPHTPNMLKKVQAMVAKLKRDALKRFMAELNARQSPSITEVRKSQKELQISMQTRTGEDES